MSGPVDQTAPAQLYAVFHLNLGYSAIEVDARPKVVERCYWPLLAAVERTGLPVGIELTGFTLEQISIIDPPWLDAFRGLVELGLAELVGSGRSQLIGPLVPAAVIRANLELGQRDYEAHLGLRPRLVLVGEQAYSSSLVDHYAEAGFEGLVMEWNNAASNHPEWGDGPGQRPARVRGNEGHVLPILWNDAIAFQKFQRYAHGEQERAELVGWLADQRSRGRRALCLYGNDAEVFDHRPGRYASESRLAVDGEWQRIESLFQWLRRDDRFECRLPSRILEVFAPAGQEPGKAQGEPLVLGCAAKPVQVKKQGKYNVTRWAVTGRDDLGLNSACHRLHRRLSEQDPEQRRGDDWRALCDLWSSDLRTHITDRRWQQARRDLAALESRLGADPVVPGGPAPWLWPAVPETALPAWAALRRDHRRLLLRTSECEVELSTARGLAILGLAIRPVGDARLCGTLPHGYFDDIVLGADFYSGHLVFESPARAKITDLSPCTPELCIGPEAIALRAHIETPLGSLFKMIVLRRDVPEVEIHYRLAWERMPLGALRLGHLTLLPEAFDAEALEMRSHLGGERLERFGFGECDFAHGAPVSFLVSANTALGLSRGELQLGDAKRRLRARIDMGEAALVAMVSHQRVREKHLTRVAFSAREMDETSREGAELEPWAERCFRFRIGAVSGG